MTIENIDEALGDLRTAFDEEAEVRLARRPRSGEMTSWLGGTPSSCTCRSGGAHSQHQLQDCFPSMADHHTAAPLPGRGHQKSSVLCIGCNTAIEPDLLVTLSTLPD